MKKYLLLTGVFAASLILAGCSHQKTTGMPEPPAGKPDVQPPVREESTKNTQTGRPLSFAVFDPDYTFRGHIEETWQGEYVPEIEAINIYDTQASGGPLEKSLIFIRKFHASDFLTLATVNILEREETEINGRKAIRYLIEKKSGVADFPHQPDWRSARHTVVDIRKSPASPTTFYVFAKAPSLSAEVFQSFLESLVFWNDPASFRSPIDDGQSRTTKKPFGIYVTPEISPVPNDRFTGYHTGVDFETTAEEKDLPVPIWAICGGKILERTIVDGYGGVVTQVCEYGAETLMVLYGHVTHAGEFPPVGAWVIPGERLASLAAAESPLSGGTRKHLHLGIYRGANIDVRGYVQNADELARWLDPERVIFGN